MEIIELKDCLREAEMQLAKTISEKENIEANRKNSQIQMQHLGEKLIQRDQASQKLDEMYRQLENKLVNKDMQQRQILDQTSGHLNDLQKEITYRETEISQLRNKIKDREAHCDAALVSNALNKHSIKQMQDKAADTDQQVADLRQKLFDTQKALDEAVLDRKSQGTALLQAEHYKQDNDRLIKLLASTKEFANFGEFATDSGQAVRYLDSERQPAKCHPKKESKLKDFKQGEEMEDWIPEEAFKVAHDFRNNVAAQVSSSLMNQFLNDLNKVWKEREQKQIARIKSECNREVQFLRRQVQFRKPYNKVMHQTEVKRLKDQLIDTKSALRENVAVIQQDSKGPNTDGLLMVDQTVKYTNQIQMERRKLQEEKEELQAQLDSMRVAK